MRLVTWMAGIVTLIVVIGAPLAYFAFGYRYHSGHVEAQAGMLTRAIEQLVARNPTMWQFESLRVGALLRDSPHEQAAQALRLTASDGELVSELETGTAVLAWPLYRYRQPIHDVGQVVGQLTIERSLRPLLLQTAIVAGLTILLAGLVFTVLRVLPLRVLRRAVDQAAFLASHDPLTSLPNRALLLRRLEHVSRRVQAGGSPAAVLSLDLDHFKEVNDILGHGAGDKLLVLATQRIAGQLRARDVLARVGGDEFIVILDTAPTPEVAASLAARIIEALARPFDLDGQEALVGTSIGVTLIGQADTGDAERLLKEIDLALYAAKAEGRGRYRFFEDSMTERLRQRKTLEHDMLVALAEQQFELHYQPQFDLATSKVVGAEALIRWNHPEHGWIAPEDFVPLAEQVGIILPLGEWILRRACREAATWETLTVAVNVSPLQVRFGRLVETVRSALEESGLPAARLELEITEGMLLNDTRLAFDTFSGIRELGVRIVMDDFGTGYSSLGYLRRFPFDKIKIDQSFVAELGEHANCEPIIRSIVALGHALGICVNAEGVESTEQLCRLEAQGCDQVQGFHLGRPMPCAAFRALIASSQEPSKLRDEQVR